MKLNPKFLVLGAFIGLILFISWVKFWPNRLLTIVFCDVGQGDAIYLRFPKGIDMLVDGGPANKVLTCLGEEMPFFDRKIDLVALTHPQKDHLQGLIEVLKRYQITTFISTPIGNNTEGFKELEKVIKEKQISVKKISRGAKIRIGEVDILTLWPDKNWLDDQVSPYRNFIKTNELGFMIDAENKYLGDLNSYSLYLYIKYKEFDLLLTGDGDSRTQSEIIKLGLLPDIPLNIELFKVPHHGAKTALLPDFLNILRPKYSVIQVGKNSYGQPDPKTINLLKKFGQVLRNDEDGKIKFKSDGQKILVFN